MNLSPRQRGFLIGLSRRRRLDEGAEAMVSSALAGELPAREFSLLIDRLRNEYPKARRKKGSRAPTGARVTR